MIQAIVLLLSLFLLLFCFFYYTKDDLFFFRKNITLEILFNTLLISIFCSLLISRLVFVILNFQPKYLSPVVFLLIPYFPGISVFGGILGFYISAVIFTRRKKINTKRFLDYAAVAILVFFPLFFLISSNYYLCIMYLVLFIFFINILMPKYNQGLLKEGSVAIIFLIMSSLVFVMHDLFLLYTKNILLSKDALLFIILFFVSSFLLVRLEIKSGR